MAVQSRARGPEATQDPQADGGPRPDSEGEAGLKTSNVRLKKSRRRIVQAQEGSVVWWRSGFTAMCRTG